MHKITIKAFNLIELSISMIITSILSVILLFMIGNYDKFEKEKITVERLTEIEKFLAKFVENYKGLPCPADEKILVDSKDFGIANIDSSSCRNENQSGDFVKGAVPVRNLELSDDYSFDGWGRKFTYIIPKSCAIIKNASLPINITNCSETKKISIKKINNYIDNNNIYLILSHGPNGFGATDYYGNKIKDSLNFEEKANSNISEEFYDSSLDPIFDDILIAGDHNKLLLLTGSIDTKFLPEGNLCDIVKTLQDPIKLKNLCNNIINCINYTKIMSDEIIKKCF